MIIPHMDLKSGIVKVTTETLDDLWHLEKVLEPGDALTARTLRKTTVKRGSEIREGDRKPVTLTLNLEKMEFHPDSHCLRLTGPIIGGPQDKIQMGSYHTINLGIRDSLKIRKRVWKSYQLDRLKKARIKKSLLLICSLDREDAHFAVLKESGLEHLAIISSTKILDQDNQEAYHKDILSYLDGKKDVQTIVLSGPGFERDNLFNFLKKARPELASKCIVEHANSAGRAGITELVKTSANRILKDTRIARETSHVEKFLEEMNKEGLATYGPREVRDAVKLGAVQTLLVSEDNVRELEGLMNQVEKLQGKVVIIASDHESGEKLLRLGGIGAILRYRI